MTCKRLVLIILTTIGILGAASCADTKDSPIIPGDGKKLVNLTFSVEAPSAAMPSRSRATVITVPDDQNYFEQEASDYERINTLRVIIIRPDNTVEHNRLVIFKDGEAKPLNEMDFRVIGGETKKIYLLGNEAGVPFDFASISEGSKYTPGTIENIKIEADPTTNVLIDNTGSDETKKYIPMCEVHDVFVKIPATVEDRYQDAGTLFITRAAVKFTFNITAQYGDGLYITDITFNGLANQEYYLPNATTYNPPKTSDPIKNWSGAPDPNLDGRFITEYSIPQNTIHSPQSISFKEGLALSTEKKTWAQPIYFCESKKIDPANITEPYTVSITVAAKDDEGNFTDSYTFDPVRLPNLPILPRNTHVLVNITLTGTTPTCTVQLVPYTGIWLNPEFGIDR